MKKFKGSLLGLLLIVMAGLFAMAFTTNSMAAEKETPTFYYYLLQTGGDPYTEADYTVRQSSPPMPCGGENEVCWIKAEDNGFGEPAITTEVESEIDRST